MKEEAQWLSTVVKDVDNEIRKATLKEGVCRQPVQLKKTFQDEL